MTEREWMSGRDMAPVQEGELEVHCDWTEQSTP